MITVGTGGQASLQQHTGKSKCRQNAKKNQDAAEYQRATHVPGSGEFDIKTGGGSGVLPVSHWRRWEQILDENISD
jgi:hypothetical protein